jgi:hypothetical protein
MRYKATGAQKAGLPPGHLDNLDDDKPLAGGG